MSRLAESRLRAAAEGDVEVIYGRSLQPIMLASCERSTRHARERDALDELADCIVRPVQVEAAAGG
jgi:hypothetical protein